LDSCLYFLSGFSLTMVCFVNLLNAFDSFCTAGLFCSTFEAVLYVSQTKSKTECDDSVFNTLFLSLLMIVL